MLANATIQPVCAKPDRYETPIPECYLQFDFEKQLSFDLVRVHCKIDDVPSVSDEQLALYRKASVEAAEQYTGLLLSGQRTVIEAINRDPPKKLYRDTYRHTLSYPSANGIVYLYGGRDGLGNQTIHTVPGARDIDIPILSGYIDLTNCCNPCSPGSLNLGFRVMYLAGFKDGDCIPAGIIVGCLKYIAWSLNHPGDVISSVRNSQRTERGLIDGSNNTAWASGALELWRQYNSFSV